VEEIIAILARKSRWPICIGKENPYTPEDSGGSYKYLEFQLAMKDNNHPNHNRLSDQNGYLMKMSFHLDKIH